MVETSQDPPNLQKFKAAQKWLKSDFQGLPRSDLKVTLKVTFKSLWGRPQKSLFTKFWATFIFGGVAVS